MSADIRHVDVVDGLRSLPPESVHTVITSPPYFGLRRYAGVPDRVWSDGLVCSYGLEPTIEEYVRHTVEIWRELRRVLRNDGICWLNLGDSYAGGGAHAEPVKYAGADASKPVRPRQQRRSGKDLLLMPHRVALALQSDGWIVRQTVVWAKGVSFCPSYAGSVMPESTRDRPTHAHEYIFQLVKKDDYYYDIDGCREPYASSTVRDSRRPYRGTGRKLYAAAGVQDPSDTKRRVLAAVARGSGRNLRNVWLIGKQPSKTAHFATFPEKLVEPLVRLSTSDAGVCPRCGAQYIRHVVREGVPDHVKQAFEASRSKTAAATGRSDGHTQRRPNFVRAVVGTSWRRSCECGHRDTRPAVVLDPFTGSGRTGIVATKLGRHFIGFDASAGYVAMAIRAVDGCDLSTSADRLEPGVPGVPDSVLHPEQPVEPVVDDDVMAREGAACASSVEG